MKQKLGITADFIEGSGGVFDVRADGKLIFSKHETGRFPENAEILDALAKL